MTVGLPAQARYRPLFPGRRYRGAGSAGRDRRQVRAAGALAGDRRGTDRVHQQPRLAAGRRHRDLGQRRQCGRPGAEARRPAGPQDRVLQFRRRRLGPRAVLQPGQGRQPGRDDDREHGPDDRLRGRLRHPVVDADGDQPERLDRLHQEQADGSEIRQDEARADRLRRRRASRSTSSRRWRWSRRSRTSRASSSRPASACPRRRAPSSRPAASARSS